jgi:hypothetical protein
MSAFDPKRTSQLRSINVRFWGVKRTWRFQCVMSAFDPKRTLRSSSLQVFVRRSAVCLIPCSDLKVAEPNASGRYRSPFKSRLRCALTARVRISAIIALSVRPSACAISRSLRSTSGATTLRTITTRSVRGERADNVRAMDCEAPLPLPLGSRVLVIATPTYISENTKTGMTIISRWSADSS